MKSINYKQITLLIIALFFTIINLLAQDERLKKPLRVGVKIGLPNIATINGEYVTPLLNNRIAITADYMKFSKTIDDSDFDYNNFEIGTNIYFGKKGKGFYAGVSYFSFDATTTFSDVEFGANNYGDGTGDVKFNTTNLKLGLKLGKTFYSRVEVGYGFGDIPERILVTKNGSSETAYEEIPEIPGISESGLFIVNVGFGFGFL